MTTIKQMQRNAAEAKARAAKSKHALMKGLWRENEEFWKRQYRECTRGIGDSEMPKRLHRSKRHPAAVGASKKTANTLRGRSDSRQI